MSATVTVSDLLAEHGEVEWSVFEDAAGGRAWLIGLFPTAIDARGRSAAMVALLREFGLGPIAVRAVAETEWRESYRAHFRAWQFGRLHWVPIWERETFVLPAGDTVLWLDPGMAFGTGNHESTRLCVERLVAIAEETGAAGKVVDVGCGSGILALSAAKLGFRDVVGFDNDSEAVRVSRENAAANGLTGAVGFFSADIAEGLAGIQADVVLANILANVLEDHLRVLLDALAPGGTLVLSGILATECARLQESFALASPDWPQTSRTLGEWSDLVLTRPMS